MQDYPKRLWLHGEPSVDDLLAEPLTHLVMQRDGVKSADLREALDMAAKGLRQGSRGPDRNPSE